MDYELQTIVMRFLRKVQEVFRFIKSPRNSQRREFFTQIQKSQSYSNQSENSKLREFFSKFKKSARIFI